MMKRMMGIGVVALSMVCMSQPAWAARTRFHVAAESQMYKEKMGGMLGRGLLNILTSFVDVLVNTVNETKAGPPLIGTLTGLAKGTGCGVLRLGSGAVDVATFWVPGFNGFPVSDSYDNCLAGMESTAALEPEGMTRGFEPMVGSEEGKAQRPEPAKKVWKK